MTTNCIVEPRKSYADRIFTTGEVGWEGVRHIEGRAGQPKDYSQLIRRAQELPGFEWEPPEAEAKYVTTGYARNAVLGVAGEVVKAVQEGHLKHIFLIGGCDGSGERQGEVGFGGRGQGQDLMQRSEAWLCGCCAHAAFGQPLLSHTFATLCWLGDNHRMCRSLPAQSPSASTLGGWPTPPPATRWCSPWAAASSASTTTTSACCPTRRCRAW